MFSWDEVKNRSNQQKHSISFETAKLIFDDPLHVSRQDRYENGEERWQTIGVVGGVALLLVVHTWHESDDETRLQTEHRRIISARRATKLERKIYESNT